MSVSGTSIETALASMATGYAHEKVQNQVAMSVLKEQMDQQKMQGQQLVQMINSSSLDGSGQLVNRTA